MLTFYDIVTILYIAESYHLCTTPEMILPFGQLRCHRLNFSSEYIIQPVLLLGIFSLNF